MQRKKCPGRPCDLAVAPTKASEGGWAFYSRVRGELRARALIAPRTWSTCFFAHDNLFAALDVSSELPPSHELRDMHSGIGRNCSGGDAVRPSGRPRCR